DFQEDAFPVPGDFNGLTQVYKVSRSTIPLGETFAALRAPLRLQYATRHRVLIHVESRAIVPHRDKAPTLGNDVFNEGSTVEMPRARINENRVGEIEFQKLIQPQAP